MAPLKQSCALCEHYDGDVSCSLPVKQQVIRGAILEAERVGCDLWEKRESDTHREQLEAIDKQTAAEGIAYENKLSLAGGQY